MQVHGGLHRSTPPLPLLRRGELARSLLLSTPSKSSHPREKSQLHRTVCKRRGTGGSLPAQRMPFLKVSAGDQKSLRMRNKEGPPCRNLLTVAQLSGRLLHPRYRGHREWHLVLCCRCISAACIACKVKPRLLPSSQASQDRNCRITDTERLQWLGASPRCSLGQRKVWTRRGRGKKLKGLWFVRRDVEPTVDG